MKEILKDANQIRQADFLAASHSDFFSVTGLIKGVHHHSLVVWAFAFAAVVIA